MAHPGRAGRSDVRRFVPILRDRGIAVSFADVHAPVLERARQTGFLEVVGEGRVFPTVDAAVREIEGRGAGRTFRPRRDCAPSGWGGRCAR